MARGGRERPAVQVTLDRLEAKGLSGLDEAGRRQELRAGAVGQVVRARRGRKGKAELLEVLQPAPDQVVPPCEVYGLCGGCQLQPMPLHRQREEKARLVQRLVGHPCHGCEGAPDAYGYRNKLELSWSPRRYTPAPPGDPAELDGSWLGFHPPGWFSRVVDVTACPLGTAAMNRVIATVRALAPGPPWDNTRHVGLWRHLVLRQGDLGLLVTLVTHPDCPPSAVQPVAQALAALPEVSGVLWRVNDGVAEVATGELRAVLHGHPDLHITVSDQGLGRTTLALPPEAFFQVNTAGAGVLFDRIGQALGEGGTLVDLYCGVGAIGLHLAHRHDRVVGVELLESAVLVARDNARRLGLPGQWHAGPVEEVLPTLDLPAPRRVVVDPPRVGLHPKAAAFLADLQAEVLVYVACSPASLGRDRLVLEAGGWRLTDLWAVDLFPQTRHVEAVARFTRG